MGEQQGPTAEMWEHFYDVYRGMPRGGPGDAASTRRALALMIDLPARPRVLDMGCGPGSGSVNLAVLTGGRVTAFDLYGPFVGGQRHAARQHPARVAVDATCGDMRATPFARGAFDLVWAEGSLYSIGFRNGLAASAEVIKPGGYLAASEAVWTVPDPPDEVRQWWEGEYPDIGSINDKAHDVASAGFDIVGHFTLPASSWWDEYYVPMRARLASLREPWANDPVGLDVAAMLEHEINMFERFGHCYSYEFFVGRRQTS
jgi:SAM-dependent methyltransferase